MKVQYLGYHLGGGQAGVSSGGVGSVGCGPGLSWAVGVSGGVVITGLPVEGQYSEF